MLYRDLNAVKASISQLSVPSNFLSPQFELIPPTEQGEDPTTPTIIPSSPVEIKVEKKKENPAKERTKEP